jgi:phosphate/sulfate permease
LEQPRKKRHRFHFQTSSVIITLALLFDFLNGMDDAADSIASIVST